MAGRLTRLSRGETTINFYGRRNIGFLASGVLVLVTIASLFTQGLNLGIDFKGGVAIEVPATGSLTIASTKKILETEKIDTAKAKIQILSTGNTKRIRIQMGDQPAATVGNIQRALAKEAKATVNDVSVSTVSSTWGWSITKKSITALLVFFAVVSLYISLRFEWGMAVSAIVAMAHDVIISVGVYSVLNLEVTPATVVAFLTILGFSLYDTIVVFDKVHENNERFSGSKVSYGDIVNVSMNQVLMRSLNTSIAAVLPVLSLLVLGAGVFGAVALREFALALLVGLITGVYSSIYIASPLLGILKERSAKYKSMRGQLSLASDMTHLMTTGAPLGRRASARAATDAEKSVVSPAAPVEALLSHPPRPRKKSRR
jgi:preprotein translocase subunit SecF